ALKEFRMKIWSKLYIIANRHSGFSLDMSILMNGLQLKIALAMHSRIVIREREERILNEQYITMKML
ncbi:MAG: hypothetical protein ACXAAO_14705, partial [Candidatus Thorarchaeota archaeon]